MIESDLTPRLAVAIQPSTTVEGLISYREVLLTLLDLHALHLAPLERIGTMAEWQHDPRMARAKGQLEAVFRAHLDAGAVQVDDAADPVDVVATLRSIARRDLVPAVYDWLALTADRAEVAAFLAVEGGPDADFDDLVALCQVGLAGTPKLTLAANYWDEMGRGTLSAVHTELHREMVHALDLPVVPVDELPVEALERKVLGGYLATNRVLQPEMIGALGLLECQAGPRCRKVVTALHRTGASPSALPFYEEHAAADPHHGKDWLDHAVVPLLDRFPEWGARVVRGARWRSTVNQRFFGWTASNFGCAGARAA